MPSSHQPFGELEACLSFDSVTHITSAATAKVLVVGSHGGIYSARYIMQYPIRAIILNDAGVGKDRAGIVGLALLGEAGVPAATVSHCSARIGDGADCLARGEISHCNGIASKLGVKIGMPARAAVAKLRRANLTVRDEMPAETELRQAIHIADAKRPVIITDSASLVRSSDEDAVVVTGSHGGLPGGRPETAIKAGVFAAVFNDAGIGIDEAGVSRLAALDQRGIAAATVDAWTARIGDGRSSYEDGTLSCVNKVAEAFGAKPGMAAREFVARVAQA